MLIKSKKLMNNKGDAFIVVDLLWDGDTNRYALGVDDYWCSGYHYYEDEAMKWFDVITMREIVDIVTDACAVGES